MMVLTEQCCCLHATWEFSSQYNRSYGSFTHSLCQFWYEFSPGTDISMRQHAECSIGSGLTESLFPLPTNPTEHKYKFWYSPNTHHIQGLRDSSLLTLLTTSFAQSLQETLGGIQIPPVQTAEFCDGLWARLRGLVPYLLLQPCARPRWAGAPRLLAGCPHTSLLSG